MVDEEQPEAAEDEAVDAAEGGDDGQEEEARAQGWAPKSEYRGDPRKWVPADEYLRRGDPKYLRQSLDKTQKELADLRRAREQDARAFADRLDRFEAMSKAQRTKLYGDIETARRQAVESGDTAEYDRLNRVEADLYEQEVAAGKQTSRPKEPEQVQAPEDVEIIEAWIEDNPWWDTDPQMQHAAMTINARIAKQQPDLSTQEQLDKTLEQVKKRFPDKFGKPAAKAQPRSNGHSAVESGQRMAGAPRGKGFSDIPAEEQKIIARHIEEGLYKDKAEAAKAYWRT